MLRAHLPLLAAWLLALLATAPALHAHDPYEITADFRSDAKHVELRLTLARLTALKLARPETNGRTQFGPNQFEEVRPALEKCARRIIVLRAGDQAPDLLELTASLTPESDIEFRAIYARPAASVLRFEATFLRDLEDPGYVAIVQWFHERRIGATHRLRRDEPGVELTVPAVR